MGSTDRTALIVHPSFGLMGGDYVTLEIAKALIRKGYDVTVASESKSPDERSWTEEEVLKDCVWFQLPRPRWNRLKSFQRLFHADELTGQTPDIVFEAQKSSYIMPDTRTVSIVYHPGDLLYYWGNGGWSKRELYYSFIRKTRGLF